MRHKADADAEVIEKKREEHQVEYQARRKERLRRGLREFQPFLKEKPVFQRTVSVSSGPRLGVLVKGTRAFFCCFLLCLCFLCVLFMFLLLLFFCVFIFVIFCDH